MTFQSAGELPIMALRASAMLFVSEGVQAAAILSSLKKLPLLFRGSARLCIVPFGLEEGEERELENQEFALVLGEQATFQFFSHATPKLSNGTEPSVGTVLRNWKQELSELHPIETMLDKAEGDGKTVRVKLKSKVTELGVLELWCVAPDSRKWKLEFDIRGK